MLRKFQMPSQITVGQLDVVLGLTLPFWWHFELLFSFTFPYIDGEVDIVRVVLPAILYVGLVGCMVHTGNVPGHQGVLTDVMQTNREWKAEAHWCSP